jgi:hypothetical protein
MLLDIPLWAPLLAAFLFGAGVGSAITFAVMWRIP